MVSDLRFPFPSIAATIRGFYVPCLSSRYGRKNKPQTNQPKKQQNQNCGIFLQKFLPSKMEKQSWRLKQLQLLGSFYCVQARNKYLRRNAPFDCKPTFQDNLFLFPPSHRQDFILPSKPQPFGSDRRDVMGLFLLREGGLLLQEYLCLPTAQATLI